MSFRFHRVCAIALLALSASSITALAQSPANPVMAHYRAYRAALEKGDTAAAETEAAAALEASRAASGDGGNTGPLALNLALARLELRRPADALEPAKLAFAIAEKDSARVDPLLAALALGRAELSQGEGRDGWSRLNAALANSQKRADLNADTYGAAIELGRSFSKAGAYGRAIEAYQIAVSKADAIGTDKTYIRAESRIALAATLITQTIVETSRSQNRPTDTRIGAATERDFRAADAVLLDAEMLTKPAALTPGPDGGLTLGQIMYATVLAWRSQMNAYSTTRDFRAVGRNRADLDLPPDNDPRPYCSGRLLANPKPQFPPGAKSNFVTGAVVVRMTLDDAGAVKDSRVAAAVPSLWFEEAVGKVAPSWRVERTADSPANCRFRPVQFIPIVFYFR